MRANFRHVVLKTAALLGAVALTALLTPAVASAGPTDWTTLRALNITHQGGENEAPSATMYAFERSMKLGSDMLEVDVNTTKDDKLAIIHDGAVDRTTNGTGPVADYTMAELREARRRAAGSCRSRGPRRTRPRTTTSSAASVPAEEASAGLRVPATSGRSSSPS